MKFQHVRFHGFGYQLPPNKISSDAIEERLAPVYKKLKLPKGRLELMSGIKNGVSGTREPGQAMPP